MFAPGLQRAETVPEMVERLSMPIPEAGCYAWLGGHSKGYAKTARGKRVAPLVYQLKNGPLPEGTEVDHLCRMRWCVNPDHLEPVTHQENVRRAWQGYVPKPWESRAGYLREWRAKQRAEQGLPPQAPHKGQRKFQCDTCGEPYEVLAVNPSRGPRYGCRKCRQAYYRNRRRKE